MALKSEFDLAVNEIFNDFDDVPVDITYIVRDVISNPDGSTTVNESGYPLRAIMDSINADIIALVGDVDSSTLNLLIRTSELIQLVPQGVNIKDQITINMIRYKITRWFQDPAQASTNIIVSKA